MSRFQPSSESILAGGEKGALPDFMPPKTGTMDRISGGRPDAPLIADHIPAMSTNEMSDARMLQVAAQCYDNSENYFNASHRTRVMDAMSRFRSQHPRGSKYWTEAFRRRSKVFRPKTRSVIRHREAAAIIAMFTTSDVVSVSAQNNGDADAARDARIQDALLNQHLTNDPRFYLTVAGALQDADRQGIVCAATEWQYREATRYFDELGPDGTKKKHAVKTTTVDRPDWRLIPIENIRFSPAASWTDIVNTTPFLIELRPMYVSEIREYTNNKRARLKYRNLSDAELMAGTKANDWDPIRVQREGNKQDRYAHMGEIKDYTVVWVHRNIVRIQGEDYIYDTIGTQVMLSDVVPLSQVDPRGYRGYVIGSAMIESHNPYPDGAATVLGPLQDEINDTANLRSDANKMASAGRMFIKRTAGVDINRLVRFSPGMAVEMDDPTSIKWDRPAPPPQSSFEENNLLNTEADDLIGSFQQGSVAANRQLNETVGGMSMLQAGAAQMTEYDLRTLGKTFFEPLLRQTMDLIRLYETDREMAAVVGKKYEVTERQYWNSLQTPTELTVNVGFGSTNPMARLSRLMEAMGTVGKFFPYLLMMSDQTEIVNEVFGAVGFPNAERFFPFMDKKSMQDPKYRTLIMQLNQMRMLSFPHVAQAQGQAMRGQAQAQGTVQAAQIKAQSDERIAQMNNAAQLKLRMLELQLAQVELQLQQENTELKRSQLMMQREKLANDISVAQQQLVLEAQGTALQQPHTEMEQLPPEMQEMVRRLAVPGSGNVNLQSIPDLYKVARGLEGGGAAKSQGSDLMKAGELARATDG